MKLLRRLSLSATHVCDPGLKHLVGLTTLESLNLSNTSVTNHGLEHLRELHNRLKKPARFPNGPMPIRTSC